MLVHAGRRLLEESRALRVRRSTLSRRFSERPDAQDITLPLGYTDCVPGIEQIECMGRFHDVFISGQWQLFIH